MTIRGTFTILVLVFLLFFASMAGAADIAVARMDGMRLTLTDQRAGCDWAEGAKRVRLEKNGEVFLGCYMVIEGVVFIGWDDGDMDQVPGRMFEPTV